MSRFPELRKSEFEAFLKEFSRSLRFENDKWVGISAKGKTFTVHNPHGDTRKFRPDLVENVAKDLGITYSEFKAWYDKK